MDYFKWKVIVITCILSDLSKQPVAKRINQTKYNVIIRTLFYKDKQGRLLLATGPLPSRVERTVREHIRGHIDFKNVDQIRIEPVFRTVHDILKSKDETLNIVQKVYPFCLSAKIKDSDTRKIINDMRRNSKSFDQAWFYNVVSLNFSPLPSREGNQPSNQTNFEKETPNYSHFNQASLHDGIIRQPPPNNVLDQQLSNEGIQTPDDQAPPSDITNSTHPGEYNTIPASIEETPPTYKQPPPNYEPTTDMFPDGRPSNLTANKPTSTTSKVIEPSPESGSKETMPEQSSNEKSKNNDELHEQSKGEHNQPPSVKSKENESFIENITTITKSTRKPMLFVPNDIFYAIEKRCANWSDDCQLTSPNRFGSLKWNVYPILPPKMVHWE